MSTITSLSRDQRGKIVEKFDKAIRAANEAHSTALTVCKGGIRGEAANDLLVVLDRLADCVDASAKRVGELLDELTEDR